MRLTPITLAFGITAGLLAAPSAHAAALPTVDADPPTYSCVRDKPTVHVYPPWVHGIHCTAPPGAPTGGTVNGPVKLIIEHPRYSPGNGHWRCGRALLSGGGDTPDPLNVLGTSCQPEG
jgi:hypothetical protein